MMSTPIDPNGSFAMPWEHCAASIEGPKWGSGGGEIRNVPVNFSLSSREPPSTMEKSTHVSTSTLVTVATTYARHIQTGARRPQSICWVTQLGASL
jgi:hypothetical protein